MGSIVDKVLGLSDHPNPINSRTKVYHFISIFLFFVFFFMFCAINPIVGHIQISVKPPGTHDHFGGSHDFRPWMGDKGPDVDSIEGWP